MATKKQSAKAEEEAVDFRAQAQSLYDAKKQQEREAAEVLQKQRMEECLAYGNELIEWLKLLAGKQLFDYLNPEIIMPADEFSGRPGQDVILRFRWDDHPFEVHAQSDKGNLTTMHSPIVLGHASQRYDFDCSLFSRIPENNQPSTKMTGEITIRRKGQSDQTLKAASLKERISTLLLWLEAVTREALDGQKQSEVQPEKQEDKPSDDALLKVSLLFVPHSLENIHPAAILDLCLKARYVAGQYWMMEGDPGSLLIGSTVRIEAEGYAGKEYKMLDEAEFVEYAESVFDCSFEAEMNAEEVIQQAMGKF